MTESSRDLGKRLGISQTLVVRKRRQGKSDEQIAAEAERERAKPSGGRVKLETYFESQARKESALANLRELELAEKSGRLVDREENERAAFEAARAVRDAMLTVPDRIASILAAETSPVRVHEILTAEFRTVLETLATTIERIADSIPPVV